MRHTQLRQITPPHPATTKHVPNSRFRNSFYQPLRMLNYFNFAENHTPVDCLSPGRMLRFP
ncbi:hypothetical protein Pan153_20630 [Gimesia panareensis]|uniref:Uncharacterized protein n=1 Tax=Gimesia panareensis TaxID=2527978 RepID=A0A518FMB9_9PLAN|nr:hypothetical protein Pan153_20630 [Gimesia panareensis]